METTNEVTGTSRGVWTSLGVSFRALQDLDREVLTQLTVFDLPVSMDEIYSVIQLPLGTTVSDVSATMYRLVAHSLLNVNFTGKFSMYPVVKQFAQSHLKKDVASLHYNAVCYYMKQGLIDDTLRAR